MVPRGRSYRIPDATRDVARASLLAEGEASFTQTDQGIENRFQ
jgi:hypothetical protein